MFVGPVCISHGKHLLHSSCLPIHLPACISVAPLDWFSWILILRIIMKIHWENPNLVKIIKYLILYMKKWVCFVLLAVEYVAWQYREHISMLSWQTFLYSWHCWQWYIHQQYVGNALSHLHGNSGYAKMQQCCVIHTLPTLYLTLFLNNLRIDTLKSSNNITLVTSISSLIFRTTVYIEHMTAWYDLKTHNEVINLKFFSKITKSVGTAGLTGLDRLFSFMIVTELQVCFMNMFHFTCNCVFLIISMVKPTRCTNVSNLFYFGMTLYMFRTVLPSIIWSSRLYIQQQASAVCTVLNSKWWVEGPSETCRVSFENKINLIHWCILLVLL